MHEFGGEFRGRACEYRVTSVAGHVYSTDFPPEFQSWDAVEPLALFDAPTRKVPADKGGKICRHLQTESRGCDFLVLWLDCDRGTGEFSFYCLCIVARALNKTSLCAWLF